MKNHNDISMIIGALQCAGLSIYPAPGEGQRPALRFRYRNNPDGTKRWVWPAGCKRAYCLKFYHSGTRRSRVFAGLIRFLFGLGLSRIFASGSFVVYGKLEEDMALFTGTAGPNRKMLLYQRGRFTKIALSFSSDALIRREAAFLWEWAEKELVHIKLPRLLSRSHHCITMEELSGGRSRASSEVQDGPPWAAMRELACQSRRNLLIRDTPWWGETMSRLASLKTIDDNRLPQGMIRKLQCLAESISVDLPIGTCRAHGDLTPWNMLVAGDRVGIFDWEMTFEMAPDLFDTLHYVIQSAILEGHEDEMRIWERLRLLQAKTGEGIWLQLRLYLLIQCSNYLLVYHEQGHWHLQVHWLLRTWNGLLNLLLSQDGVLSQRQLFCMDLFDTLRDQPYAALKWLSPLPEYLSESSDIDLCVGAGVGARLDRLAAQHPFVRVCRTRHRSFMRSYSFFFLDDSLLSLDAIRDVRRKQLRMLDTEELLKGATFNNAQVKVPLPAMDLSYLGLFYLLNRAPVPERYRPWVDRQQADLPPAIAPAFVYDDRRRREALLLLAHKRGNKGWGALVRRVQYIGDSLRDLLGRRGLIVTFTGVDGAGKSTVIEHVRRQLEKKWRKRVVVLRHRPGLIPILSAWSKGRVVAENAAASGLPRQGKNSSLLSSLMRFAYYYSDYLLGQFYIRWRYVGRGYIVLYDRYYFDLINDGRRSNMDLPPWLTAFFYRLLLKPDFNFFLHAPESVILGRKQELDVATIRQLTAGYLRLFRKLTRRYKSSKYIPILNTNLDRTIAAIIKQIKNSIT